MEFNIKKFDRFEITGRGTVFTMHRDDNDIEGIEIGSELSLEDGTKWVVSEIERFRNMGGIGKNIGVLVKEIKK